MVINVITVILYGEEMKTCRQAFIRVLKNYFRVYSVMSDGVICEGEGRELLLVNFSRRCSVGEKFAILVAGKKADPAGIDTLGKYFFVVPECPEEKLLSALSERNVSVLFCGTSPKSDVTFSSLSSGRSVVSLQRSVVGCDGRLSEPQELVLGGVDGIDPQHLLLCAGIIFLCGKGREGKDGSDAEQA